MIGHPTDFPENLSSKMSKKYKNSKLSIKFEIIDSSTKEAPVDPKQKKINIWVKYKERKKYVCWMGSISVDRVDCHIDI